MWKNGLCRSFSSFFEKENTLGTYIHGTNCSPPSTPCLTVFLSSRSYSILQERMIPLNRTIEKGK